MMKHDVTQPEVLLVSPKQQGQPRKLIAYPRAERAAFASIHELLVHKELPPVTVVEAGRWQRSASTSLKAVVNALATKLNEPRLLDQKQNFIVLCFDDKPANMEADWHYNLLKAFRDPTNVEITFGEEETNRNVTGLLAKCQLLAEQGHAGLKWAASPTMDFLAGVNFDQLVEDAFDSLSDTMPAKVQPRLKQGLIDALKEKLARASKVTAQPPPRKSALDDVRELVEATADLREQNGNLSAKKIAELYNLSLEELGRWLGCTRQALAKTPDSDRLQNHLGYLERVARLRAVLPDVAAFRKWLRIANPVLGGKTPLQLLEEKRWQELADLVEDVLTGSPT